MNSACSANSAGSARSRICRRRRSGSATRCSWRKARPSSCRSSRRGKSRRSSGSRASACWSARFLTWKRRPSPAWRSRCCRMTASTRRSISTGSGITSTSAATTRRAGSISAQLRDEVDFWFTPLNLDAIMGPAAGRDGADRTRLARCARANAGGLFSPSRPSRRSARNPARRCRRICAKSRWRWSASTRPRSFTTTSRTATRRATARRRCTKSTASRWR